MIDFLSFFTHVFYSFCFTYEVKVQEPKDLITYSYRARKGASFDKKTFVLKY